MGATADELHDEILASPDDPAPYLVLADVLALAGDPRGELITLQHKVATGAKDKLLRVRAKKVSERFAAQLARETGGASGTWHLGFVRRGRVETDAQLGALFTHPSARVMTELEITVPRYAAYTAAVEQTLIETIRALARVERPQLRALSIVAPVVEPVERRAREAGRRAFAPRPYTGGSPWTAVPNLARLQLAGELRLPPLAHPRLAALVVDDIPLEPGPWDVPALRAVDWGRLAYDVEDDWRFLGIDFVRARIARQRAALAALLAAPPPALGDLALRGYIAPGLLAGADLRALSRLCLPYAALVELGDVARLGTLARLLVTDVPRGVATAHLARTLPNAIFTSAYGSERATVHLDARRKSLPPPHR